jgi:SAM-dependent methyltransferase
MPTIEENRKAWDEMYEWPDGGEVWSTAWGGSDMQWNSTLMPRLHCFLPAQTILEIAPGFGRWTEFLKDQCRRLIAVDIAERCVEVCRTRFAQSAHVECHLNDGKSLPMVSDGTVDLAVSFDSLVHAQEEAVDGYLGELARVLGPEGVAVLHHSNLGAFPGLDNPHSRDPAMTAGRFSESAQRHGLSCIGQELIDWGGSAELIDCISLATRPGSHWDRAPRVLKNGRFAEEAARALEISDIYGRHSFA